MTLIVLTGGYVALIIFLLIGWLRPGEKSDRTTRLPKISVVIPFRNEGEVLQENAPMDKVGSYPTNRCEFLYVDDHSEDKGPEKVVDLIHLYEDVDVELYTLTKGRGKKEALSLGIRKAGGEIISTLDADTQVQQRWLRRVGHAFGDFETQMTVLPVAFRAEKGFLQHCLSLEFISLVASGMASLKMGLPLMANGANLAFRKSAWLELSGYQSHQNIMSGDDVLFMFELDKKRPGSIRCVHDRDAIALTAPPASFKEFVRQRVRWASKARYYKQLWPVAISMLILGFNLMLLFASVAALFNPALKAPVLWCFASKITVDGIFLWLATAFFNKRYLLLFLPVVTLFYPLYIVFIGIASIFMRPKWKGRKT